MKTGDMHKTITGSKNTSQALCALCAQWSGIKLGNYSWVSVIFLIRPILGILLPKSFKDLYK